VNRQRDERGSVTLEAVLLLPVVILTIMTVVQVALFAHAAHLADAAAREGTRTLRLSGAVEAGKEHASTFLQRHGAQVVLDPVIAAEARDGVGSVEVAGHVAGVIPGLSLSVRGFSSGPLEGFDAVGATP
jgi:Flp pilus assembly protein TadG